MSAVDDLMRLADNYAHVYAFVGDDSMPIARAALRSALEAAVPQWIPVSERLPDERQSVVFVVSCKNPSYDHLDGRVLAGIYIAGPCGGFSVPGLTINASAWMPSPLPPSPEQKDTTP
jgi:hypothetical protein